MTITEMATRRTPQLPHGTPTTLSGLSETFSFHSSPEAFIASRILAFQRESPSTFESGTPVRARILNRNVAVVSSHAQICHVLSSATGQDTDDPRPAFTATEAYEPLMAAFFPGPNVLLSDGSPHRWLRSAWERRMQSISPKAEEVISSATKRAFSAVAGKEIDLYELLKTLVWRILLGLFLNLDESDPDFTQIETLQEELLRGQFSLFPVSVNVRFWQSPRSRGIAAKTKLRELILRRISDKAGACPFPTREEELKEIANHLLLFTSSLAVKAMASLLTAYLLNLFLFRRGGVALADEARGLDDRERVVMLRSILLETERLSPPIVGIMRKANRECLIPSNSAEHPYTLVPQGWDVWLYFVGGGRDPAAFGAGSAQFDPDRFRSETGSQQHGFAFSMGSKECLGQDLVRSMSVQIAAIMLREDLGIVGEVSAKGVRSWLGWEVGDDADVQEWARDMKQLPTQRPAKPVTLKLVEGRDLRGV